jgi:hypothetical protein
MASKWPPVKNAAYTFRCVLFAQSDNQIKSNPTIAAGDWKVSTDGGAFANLATLPDVDPDSSVQVLVSLSAGEMNGDEIMITAIDAAGAEWHSAAFVIHTTAQTLDTMDANIDTALTRLTSDRAGYLDKLNVSGTLAHSDAANTYKADVSSLALEATAQDILTDTAEIGAAGAGLTALATQTSVNDLPTNAELATALGTADDAVIAAIGALHDFDPATDAVIVGSIQADAITASAIAAAAANEIADAILLRSYSNVEDTAGDHTLAALIAGALESAIVGTTWTLYKTDGATAMLTKTVTVDASADPITGVE